MNGSLAHPLRAKAPLGLGLVSLNHFDEAGAETKRLVQHRPLPNPPPLAGEGTNDTPLINPLPFGIPLAGEGLGEREIHPSIAAWYSPRWARPFSRARLMKAAWAAPALAALPCQVAMGGSCRARA